MRVASGFAGLKFLGRHHDVLALVDLEALHDVIELDLRIGFLGNALVTDPAPGALLELVEADVALLRRRVQPDRDADEAEADGTAPDRAP